MGRARDVGDESVLVVNQQRTIPVSQRLCIYRSVDEWPAVVFPVDHALGLGTGSLAGVSRLVEVEMVVGIHLSRMQRHS